MPSDVNRASGPFLGTFPVELLKSRACAAWQDSLPSAREPVRASAFIGKEDAPTGYRPDVSENP